MNINPFSLFSGASRLLSILVVLSATLALRADDRLVGVWKFDEGWQITELLFRSDGRYQLDSRSTDPTVNLSTSERGRYQVSGSELFLTPYDYFGEPQSRIYDFRFDGNLLGLTRTDFELDEVLYEWVQSS
ncbi:MAG TPA: hypothetical protein VM735_13385, partial [Candidatus Kapabacteria bacterium]|nr:hypothetical protein [Candidatus Kapabacteria bacterium]